jgi:hypothetical protein
MAGVSITLLKIYSQTGGILLLQKLLMEIVRLLICAERACILIITFFLALRYVSEVEPTAPLGLTPQQYIGDKKGIQGHQNSCYLDATLFGLFALTHEFDTMFLQHIDSKSTVTANIGRILWKNIVNPLRKYDLGY